MTTPSNPKAIGALNGWWSVALRVLLAAHTIIFLPLFGWGVWMTMTMFEMRQESALQNQVVTGFISAGARYTREDANRDRAIMRAEVALLLADIKTEIESVRRDGEENGRVLSELKKKLIP